MTVLKNTRGEAPPELFLIWSVAERFRGAANVILSWFVASRDPASPAPPAPSGLFRDYAQQGAPRQRILDRYAAELFTAGEARIFAEWLHGAMGMKARLIRVAAPMDPRVNPTGVVPATLGVNLYVPPRASAARPPFEVWAYYDAAPRPRRASSLDPPGALLRPGTGPDALKML